jgi:hypothetical protein
MTSFLMQRPSGSVDVHRSRQDAVRRQLTMLLVKRISLDRVDRSDALSKRTA